MENPVAIADFWVGTGDLVMIAGPCVIESAELTLAIARTLKDYAAELNLPLIFKASFDKANRTSLTSYRGPGLKTGLEILARVKDEVGLPVLSDVHQVADVEPAARVLDVLQIPAFLCRQTDLLVAAAQTGKAVNIKKGQFMAPWDMGPVVDKVFATGNRRLLLTERGAMFGYNNLVVDFRSLPIMRSLGLPGGPGRDPQRPAARGAGHVLRRPKGVHPLAGPGRGGRGGGRPVHGGPSRPGPRPLRRPQFPAPGPGPAPVAATGGAAPGAPGAGVSTGFHKYAHVIYRPPHPNPLPPKRGRGG